MSAAPHDLSHLSGLIEAARQEAERLGPGLGPAATLLGQALTLVRNLAARGGEPDEGVPPAALTTENDR